MRRFFVAVGLAILVAAAAPASAAAGDVVWSHSNHSSNVQAIDSSGTVVFSAAPSGVQAVAASDGSSEWSNSLGAVDLAESNGTVAVAEDGTTDVVALDAATGTQQWTHSFHDASSSAVGANEKYVASGEDDLKVVVVDAATGKKLNSHTQHSQEVVTEIAVANETVISLADSGVVKAVDATGGGPKWDTTVSGSRTDIAASDNGDTLYLAVGQDIVARDVADGSQRWRATIADSSISDVAVDGTTVVATVDNGNVVAYNASDQQTILKTSDGSNAGAAAVDGSRWYGSYGDRVVAFSPDFSNTLVIRDEQNPTQLVTDTTNITLQAVDGDAVYKTTTSNGVADLAALDTEPLIARADPDGWGKRSLIVTDNTGKQTIYVLNNSAATSEVSFELQDQTGRFAAGETTLRIQRAIKRDGTTTFETVLSDRFGATDRLTVGLATGETYRLIVENDAGETRVLGSYSTSGDAIEPLPIGEIVLAGNARDAGVAAQASLRNGPPGASHSQEVRMILIDADRATSEFNLTIVNESDGVIRNRTTEEGPFGRYAETYPLEPSEFNGSETLYVEFNVTRNGERQLIRRPIGDVPDIATDWAINSRVLELMGFVGLVAVMGLVVIANASLAAIVGVLVAALMTLLGVLDIPPVAIGVAGSVAILYRLGDQR